MSCNVDIKKHLIEHEILGITPSSGSTTISIVDGYPTYTDTSRGGKILSLSRVPFKAGKEGPTQNAYLRVGDTIASSKTGYRMTHNGTITTAAIQLSTSATCSLLIYKNNIVSPIITLPVNGTGAHLSSLDTDFQESDIIQFYLSGTAYNPVAWIEVAWRF